MTKFVIEQTYRAVLMRESRTGVVYEGESNKWLKRLEKARRGK